MNEHADPTKMFEQLLGRDLSSLDEEERPVLASFVARRPISLDAGEESENRATFWDRLADRLAAIGGSWAFLFPSWGCWSGG